MSSSGTSQSKVSANSLQMNFRSSSECFLITNSDRDYMAGLLKLDANKDGQIDFNEFMNWLKWD
jgi:hypothetical protein